MAGIMSNLVAKALSSLGQSAFKEAASWWGARDDLKKLENSMRMIQARVRDAEKYQEDEGSDAVKEWLRRLNLVLYQADDLFDHILTVDSRKQRRRRNKEVWFLSTRLSRPPCLNWKMAREIKCIKEQLDDLKSDMTGLNLRYYDHREEPQLLMAHFMKKRETTSFVEEEDVIGRKNDKDMIIEMLFDPKYDGERVTIILIVGFGGLGKTTLAQLVLNDARVRNHFNLTEWAYVPDKNDTIVVMGKIFCSFTGKEYHNLSLQELQNGIRESIESMKYLLVLDDIWDERGDRWIDLVNLLKCGKPGSKVIVTTRSDVVAKSIGTIEEHYILGTLTDDQSWNLFERLALKPRQEQSNLSTLAEIGKEIVEMCGNVPLAIKVVAGFLLPRDTPEQWFYVRDAQRSKAQLTKGGDIMRILKLSYYDLSPALMQCFAYCSLFPKGYKFSQTELVHQWMAQGYFVASSRDTGDHYFLELLGRNLFQDPHRDLQGNVESCKMHDLVHDLAQHVAGHGSMVLGESPSFQITDELIHVSLTRSKAPQSLRNSRMLRSLLFFPSSAGSEVFLITRFQSLRVLSLKKMRIVTIPDSIGKLIHLRYLNLHKSDIECLPQPISRLENLQTLKLRKCRKLKELPRDFTEMPNLKHLVIANSGLTELPSEFGTMTSLQELDEFIVGERNGIDSVPALNLMRNLHIKFRKWRNGVVLEAQRATLMYSKRLSYLTLDWNLEGEEATPSEMVAMLTHLQLPPNIKYLHICFYRGDKMPCKWLDGLSRLVSIYIIGCDNCRVLPHLSQLPHLKDLHLEGLNALEYVEDEDDIWVSGKCGYGYATNYFPTLEALKLDELPRLKQWTRPLRIGGERQQQRHQLLFRCLLQITVKGCQQLVWMPLALKLESLEVSRGNGRLFKSNVESINDEEGSSTLYTSLKNLKIDESNNALEFLSISSRLCNLETLTIQKCDKLMSLEIECPSSIRNINIIWCTKFSNISNIVKGDFPFLETLVIWNNSEVLEEEEEGKATTTIRNWQGLTSVRHLDLWDLKKLPPGIACLTKLQFLEIGNVENLTALPEQLGNLTLLSELSILKCPKLKLLPLSLQGLTSLQTLFIRDCPYLEERYKKPYGQDCHLLQHIPHLDVAWNG